MDRRRFLLTSVAGAFATPLAAEPQQAEKVYRIGSLSNVNPTLGAPSLDAFRHGLRELGWEANRHRGAQATTARDQPSSRRFRRRAKALGLTIPQSLLARADRVIQ